MGGIFGRSSSSRPARTKPKWRKGKRQELNSMETSADGDKFHTQNTNEQNTSNGNIRNSYEDWNKKMEQQQQQQQQQQMANINDPPGAPSTYSNNYPLIQNDIMNQSWSASHDVNNQYYQFNPHSMTTTGTSTIPYDPNQYVHNHMSNSFINQSQPMLEERPSKKVQFAHPVQMSQSIYKVPLQNTQSWHELSPTNNDLSNSNTRQEPVLNRQTIHRSAMPISDPSSSQTNMQKPIYVGIDYRATLAERAPSTTTKRHHKTNEKNHSDTTDSNHRTRSHAHHHHHHHHKNQPSNDSSNSSSILQQTRTSDPQRILTTTSTSTSTVISNRQTQPIEQQSSSSLDNGIKISKTRGIRTQPIQSSEHRSSLDNETKSSRGKKHHSHHQQQQQNIIVHPNSSSPRTETIRRVENKQSGTPVMQIPASQQRQKQSGIPPSVTNTGNVNRTRV